MPKIKHITLTLYVSAEMLPAHAMASLHPILLRFSCVFNMQPNQALHISRNAFQNRTFLLIILQKRSQLVLSLDWFLS